MIVLYDSIGRSDPLETFTAVRGVREACGLPVLYHCHNDLGLAAANSLFAVYAGARVIDATINGIGDRAGNAPLEQLAVILRVKGIATGIRLDKLKALSDLIARKAGLPLARYQPIVGDPRVIFTHVSPKHKACPRAFAAYDPRLVTGGPR